MATLVDITDAPAPPPPPGATAPDFDALFAAHYPSVLAYCRRRTSEAEAADAALATFEVLWRQEVPPLEPRPWLYRVAAGHLRNAARADGRRLRLVDRLTTAAPTSTADPADLATEAGAARAALDRLSPDDREVLLLVAWEGLSPIEAAEALDVTPGTFAVRLHRARRRLEALLTPTPGDLA